MAIDRPIFVVAPHRSGTTLLVNTLVRHDAVASLTKVHHRLPWWPRAAALVDRLLKPRLPHEAQHVWDRFRGRDDDDVATAADLTETQRRFFHSMVERAIAARGRSRFVAKYQRLSLRVGWLDALFSDALFVHLRRDWRAVALSTVKRKRKRKAYSQRWFGVRILGWKGLTSRSDVEQSAAIFRHVTLEFEAQAQARRLGDRMITTSYEALCSAQRPTLLALCDQLGLRRSPRFESGELPKIRASFGGWRRDLDPAVLASIRAQDPAFFGRYELEPDSARGP